MALHVRLLGIPVRIHAWFALTGLIIWNFSGGGQLGWGTLPIALLIVFQGVLFHELGHALMGRRFGLEPEIDLAFFAGLTRWTGGRTLTPGRGVLVSFEYSNRLASYIGETLTVGGTVTAVDVERREADLELFVRNEQDEVITPGTARVRFAA